MNIVFHFSLQTILSDDPLEKNLEIQNPEKILINTSNFVEINVNDGKPYALFKKIVFPSKLIFCHDC